MFGLIVITTLMLAAGALLGYVNSRFRADADPVVDQINAILPQTQCGQCDYPGCRPYAEAIAAGEAEINQCPPGGEAGIKALAELLGREALPLDATHGEEKPKQLAVIVEDICIGCIKCIQACPVDAIVGAPQLMHTVIADECTGCELCVPPCPVDCIELLPQPTTTKSWQPPLPSVRLLEGSATATRTTTHTAESKR